eukprot:4368545-Pyramimonas_sp.AAC.3
MAVLLIGQFERPESSLRKTGGLGPHRLQTGPERAGACPRSAAWPPALGPTARRPPAARSS